MIILATGHKQLDEDLKRELKADISVDCLENIEFTIYSHQPKVLIFSEFIPVISHLTDQNERYQAIYKVLATVRNNDVRVILLTTPEAPQWFLGKCVSLGIYDIILKSEIDGSIIPSFFYNPSTKEQAIELLKSLENHKSNVPVTPVLPVEERIEKKSVVNNEVKKEPESKLEPVVQKEVVSPSNYADTLTLQSSGTTGFKVEFNKEPKNDTNEQKVEKEIHQNDSFVSNITPAEDSNETNGGLEEEEIKSNTIPFKREKKKHINLLGEQKIISFWGENTGLGSRTLSQSFATLAAERGAEVLYVEMNYFTPSFAVTSGLSHSDKNFFKYMTHFIENEDVDIEKFIANVSEVYAGKKSVRKAISKLPKKLDFLTLPRGYDVNTSFPEVDTKIFIKAYMDNLRASRYDMIVLNLPPVLQNKFTFPIMLESDLILNVTTLHPARVIGYKSLKDRLSKTPLDMEKFHTVVNMVHKNFNKEQVELFLNEPTAFFVHFDEVRLTNELDLEIGSPLINQAVGDYLTEIGLSSNEMMETHKRKRLINFK
ncbi:hypothetical protein [Cytobacillus sp. IB215665]|uniref:hypothetical protein n=1 Tax=Cytobacillus sp. IB215665 TaxID=3097357 RepID=UPI002A18442C|nr:hypothetical protein [Cytobacillus sp. IB215665]MDX8367194.1 hypothetical protein [Cytobacillus sp. IB215665]